MTTSNSIRSSLIVLMLCFFTMGVVDLVGVATNFIKEDFHLDTFTASLIPMMVFVWFAVFSIPSAFLMNRIGRKNTVLISVIITSVSLIIPFIWYDFIFILISFALVGIANTLLQVSLNPLVSDVVSSQRLASTLTFGQFVKAIASFLGPILASLFAAEFGNWTYVLFAYSLFSIVCSILLANTKIDETSGDQSNYQRATFSKTLILLKSPYVAFSFLGILVIVGIDVCMNTNIALLLSEKLDVTVQQGAYGISVYFAAKTVGAFLGAIILLKYNSNNFFKWSMLISFIGFFLLIGTSVAWLLYLGVVLIGISCANVFSIIFSNVLNYNKKEANELSSLMIMGVAGGAIITPIAGYLSTQFGLWSAFLLMLVCACYLFSLTIFLYKNLHHENNR